METQPIFQIKNIDCRYPSAPEKKVLYIDEWQIPRGEIIFLLGASGSGKSTSLEALGLMNNTLQDNKGDFYNPDSELIFFPKGEELPVSLLTLWEEGNAEKRAELRKKHFSFIFQQTNLMPNFTAYENVGLSQMIKEDLNLDSASKEVKGLMGEIGLPEAEVSEHTYAVELSGGQRQRLAFVRALKSPFTVLFGDEPTGNLDEAKARELLGIIKRELGQEQSAIIVSHDIDLALEYADQIVVIEQNHEEGYGEILSRNIFNTSEGKIGDKTWASLDGTKEVDLRSHIERLYKELKEKAVGQRDEKPKYSFENYYFKPLFLVREGLSLIGNKAWNFIILSGLILLTLLAIGFSNGTLNYLETKLNDPFVNYLDIFVPELETASTELDMMPRLNKDSVKQAFQYNAALRYKLFSEYFWSQKNNRFEKYKGRSFEFGENERGISNTLLKGILSRKGGKGDAEGFIGMEDVALVVTEGLLKRLGYDIENPPDHIFIKEGLRADTTHVPIGIRNIVPDMPGKNFYGFTPAFFEAKESRSRIGRNNPFNIREKEYIGLLIRDISKEEATNLKKELRSIVREDGLDLEGPFEHTGSYANGQEFILRPYDAFDKRYQEYDLKKKYFSSLLNYEILKPFKGKMGQVYRYNDSFTPSLNFDYYNAISIDFTSLDNVREFASYFESEFNPEDERGGNSSVKQVDIQKIIDKENFNFLSKVTLAVSYLILILSITGITLFILNLIRMHLSKVGMNLGTLKAFGLAGNEAIGIYTRVVSFVVGGAIITGILFALFIGYGINAILASGLNLENQISYFQFFRVYTLVALLAILLISLASSWWMIRRMLKKSPGDLIYKRG